MKNQGKVLSFWLEPWDWGAFSERIRFGGGIWSALPVVGAGSSGCSAGCHWLSAPLLPLSYPLNDVMGTLSPILRMKLLNQR